MPVRVVPPSISRPPLAIAARCAVGLACALGATLLRLAFQPVLDDQIPYITYVAGVVIATWAGGVAGGVTATVVSALAGDYFFVRPFRAFKTAELAHFTGVSVFVLVAAGLVWLVARWRRAERSVRQRADQLRLLAALVEHAHDAIVVRNLDERVVSWNRGAERLYGWAAEDAIGKNPHDLLTTVFPDSLEAMQVELAATDQWQGELVHARRDGSQVVSDSRHVLVRDSEGGPSLVLQIDRDVTERRRAEREVTRLNAELTAHASELEAQAEDLAQANRLKDEFLATLSHELRTPISTILGWSQLLLTGSLDQAATERAKEVIARNARAQVHLLEDLLDMSGIVMGKLRLDLQPTDIALVIERAVDTVRPAAEARQVDVRVTLDERPLLLGDAERLQQVMWNLLSNAVKFTPPQGRVDVRLARAGSTVTIQVADTGIGIDPAFLPRAFDRFSQSDGSRTRRHGGLGLGLAIVRHLVELHGGTVVVESAGEGRGSTFTVTLPIRVGVDGRRSGDDVEAAASGMPGPAPAPPS